MGKIAPSILSADFAELAAEVERIRPQADLLHVDVMDGHFVPNLTIGAPVVACLRPRTDLYLDCHLMIDNPGDLLDDFAKAGADSCTVHVELGDPRPLFDRMRAHDMRVGLVHNPETSLDAVLPYLEEIDILLFMSVHPGFGGQAFIPDVLDKLRAPRARSWTSAASRSSSRSTVASTSRRLRWPPPRARTSSSPGARSSTPPDPLAAARGNPRGRVAGSRGFLADAARQGPHRLGRRGRGSPGRQVRSGPRRAADRRGVHGRGASRDRGRDRLGRGGAP